MQVELSLTLVIEVDPSPKTRRPEEVVVEDHEEDKSDESYSPSVPPAGPGISVSGAPRLEVHVPPGSIQNECAGLCTAFSGPCPRVPCLALPSRSSV